MYEQNELVVLARSATELVERVQGAAVVACNDDGETPLQGARMSATEGLFTAVKAWDVERVRSLLDADPALVNARGDGNLTPVVTATYWGQRDVADLLIAHGAELDIHAAVALGLTERIELLLAAGADLEVRDYNVWTPLNLASHEGRPEIVALRLAAGQIQPRATTWAVPPSLQQSTSAG